MSVCLLAQAPHAVPGRRSPACVQLAGSRPPVELAHAARGGWGEARPRAVCGERESSLAHLAGPGRRSSLSSDLRGKPTATAAAYQGRPIPIHRHRHCGSAELGCAEWRHGELVAAVGERAILARFFLLTHAAARSRCLAWRQRRQVERRLGRRLSLVHEPSSSPHETVGRHISRI